MQRAKLYGANQPPTSVTKFRDDIIRFLTEKIIPQYVKGFTEEWHYKNIEALIAHANKVGSEILGPAGYKYGVAQKLLNLSLKYFWCLGLIGEPPHCPIDRIIISKTRLRAKINWTQITKRAQYEEIIKEVKELAGEKGLSVPMWELMNYSRK